MTNVTDPRTNVIPLDDTREKLEAAAQTAAGYIYGRGFANGLADAWNDDEVDASANRIIDLLDRQAAIAQRDCIDRWDAKATLEIVELQAKVDELTAELEEARKRHMENEDKLAEENDALIASVNELEADLNTAELDNEHLREELRRIEQLERDSAYMRLPVDADGVPIHLGDVVAAQDEQPFEVRAFQLDTLGWFAIERLGSQWNVNQLHHVQPDTVESLLEEFYGKTHATTAEEREELAAEYAERIRKAVER